MKLPKKTDKEDVTKKIMPNKCELCGVGIGHSMLFFENTWRPYNHLQSKVFYYNWLGGRIKICGECLEDLNERRDPDEYIAKCLLGKK